MSSYDLTTRGGRFKARWDYAWKDHGFLRRWFQNAHWVSPELARSNQPSPRQLADWKAQGIRTVVNLRGRPHEVYYALERDACDRLGLTLVDAPLDSRDAPSPERVRRAKEVFETIEYPALIHCKSGADRAGLMAVLYRHFRLGEPISEAKRELDKKYLHHREGATGVLDYTLDKYLGEAEPKGIGFLEWVQSDAYDPQAIRAEFKAGRWGKMLTDTILRRE